MTSSDPHPGLVERLKRHHDQAKARRAEAEIEAAIDATGFDLGTDLARPSVPERGPAGYDADADLGVDHEALPQAGRPSAT